MNDPIGQTDRPGPRFSRIELRTTAVAAAREFYAAVIGGDGDGIVDLPAAALARGAPAHWLGHVGLGGEHEVEAMVARMVTRGAMRLGPQRTGEPVVLRGMGDAIVALTSAMGPSRAGVVWRELNAADASRATTDCAELFGWSFADPVDFGLMGTHRPFAWRAGEPNAGAIADVGDRPGVHTHWLFFFGVPLLDDAIAEVRARNGKVIGPNAMADGTRFAVCDDPQGAAFGLMEVR